jgi:hypothetical protein
VQFCQLVATLGDLEGRTDASAAGGPALALLTICLPAAKAVESALRRRGRLAMAAPLTHDVMACLDRVSRSVLDFHTLLARWSRLGLDAQHPGICSVTASAMGCHSAGLRSAAAPSLDCVPSRFLPVEYCDPQPMSTLRSIPADQGVVTAERTTRTVFLLGAGASHFAGVPLMCELYESFLARERSVPLQEALTSLVRALQASSAETVDIEHLLRELDRRTVLLTDDSGIPRADATDDPMVLLQEELRRHVRQECSDGITPQSVRYLVPLVDMARSAGTLDIFTLNYDMTIEMICEGETIVCTDGFEPSWDPRTFDLDGTPDAPRVRLHKVHGSLVWYRRPGFRYVKMPLKPNESTDLHYFDGAPVTPMMLYPALEKEGDTSPYRVLAGRLRAALGSADLLVVLGYSFRDREIRTLVVESLVQRPQLAILLVDTDTNAVVARYNEPDQDWRIVRWQGEVESALAGQGLTTRIRSVLGAFRDMRDGINVRASNEIGSRQLLTRAALSFLANAHGDAVRRLVEREQEQFHTDPWSRDVHPLPRLDACLIFALVEGTTDRRERWWRLVVPLLAAIEANLTAQVLRMIFDDPTLQPRRPSDDFSFAQYQPDHPEIARSVEVARTFLAALPGGYRGMDEEQLRPLERQLERIASIQRRMGDGAPWDDRQRLLLAEAEAFLGDRPPFMRAQALAGIAISRVALGADWSTVRLVPRDAPGAR